MYCNPAVSERCVPSSQRASAVTAQLACGLPVGAAHSTLARPNGGVVGEAPKGYKPRSTRTLDERRDTQQDLVLSHFGLAGLHFVHVLSGTSNATVFTTVTRDPRPRDTLPTGTFTIGRPSAATPLHRILRSYSV